MKGAATSYTCKIWARVLAGRCRNGEWRYRQWLQHRWSLIWAHLCSEWQLYLDHLAPGETINRNRDTNYPSNSGLNLFIHTSWTLAMPMSKVVSFLNFSNPCEHSIHTHVAINLHPTHYDCDYLLSESSPRHSLADPASHKPCRDRGTCLWCWSAWALTWTELQHHDTVQAYMDNGLVS